MSNQYDPIEPSYYEIALTGRQVLVAFVVLLVCLVAAFFSGVWVGSGSGEDEERPVEIAREETDGEEPLQELSFFDETPMDRPRDLEDVAREPRPDTTLLEDVGGREAARDEGTAPGELEAEPEPVAPPDETGGTPPAADRSRPETRPAPSGSLSSGDVVIQVFSSAEEPKAREVLSRLEKNGFRAFLSPLTDGGRTLFRVRVGPFERRSDAEATAERLRRSMNLETWITQ